MLLSIYIYVFIYLLSYIYIYVQKGVLITRILICKNIEYVYIYIYITVYLYRHTYIYIYVHFGEPSLMESQRYLPVTDMQCLWPVTGRHNGEHQFQPRAPHEHELTCSRCHGIRLMGMILTCIFIHMYTYILILCAHLHV